MYDEMKSQSKNSFDAGRWWVLRDLSKAFFGESVYRRIDTGNVKNLRTGEVLTLDDAIDEFTEELQ